MLKIAIHAFSCLEQMEVQAQMVPLVTDCGGWVLDEKSLSLASYCLRFEIGLSSIVELYGALQRTGIQFTPMAHRALTEMCLCQKHLPKNDQVHTVLIDLRVGTLDEGNMHLKHSVRVHSA